MEPLLLGLQSQLNEIKGTLVELKAENAVLRNEILGISTSVNSKEQPIGILEKKTLREFVEEIQFDIKSIKTEIKSGIHWRNSAVERQPEPSDPLKISVDDKKDKEDADADESLDEYPAMEIEHRTIEEHRAWMKLKFNEERAKLTDPADGKTLQGKTVESISSSIPISREAGSSSNHLNSDLTDPQEFTRRGRKLRAPTNAIIRHTREAFSFQGNEYCTNFGLSCLISKDLRIAVECCSSRNGKVGLSMGVTPEGVPTASLIGTMDQLTKTPDICSSGEICVQGPLEYLIIHGKILARAQMSPGPRSVVKLDILKVGLPRAISTCTPNGLVGHFQITNCLTMSLKNPRRFVHKGPANVALPMQVRPRSREIFGVSHTRVAEALFSYEIDSTDLDLLIAFRIQGNKNAFSAAFVPRPAVTDKPNFDSAMDPGQWRSHLYRKYANAEDGEQEIQIRNIRARVSMTVGEKPKFRFRIFAV